MKSMLSLFRMLMIVAVIATSLMVPVAAVAQGRGHGRGLAKKPLKFVNGHDARAGRFDGRGPGANLTVATHRRRGRHRGWVNGRHRRLRALRVR